LLSEISSPIISKLYINIYSKGCPFRLNKECLLKCTCRRGMCDFKLKLVETVILME